MTRDELQDEAADAWIDSDTRRGIVYACPRFGKTFVAVKVMKKLGIKKATVCFPRTDIQAGWEDTFDVLDYHIDITYITFTSLSKLHLAPGELLILDEPHELSDNQIFKIEYPCDTHEVLALTGTMTLSTEQKLYNKLGLEVFYRYGIENGVRDGVLADYNIFVHKIPLDKIIKIYKSNTISEKKYYDNINYIRESYKNKKNFISAMFMEMKLKSIVQGSISKLYVTLDMLQKWKDERVLVFCGLTSIADRLNIPAYHSKNKEKGLLDDFCKGIGKHLVTIQMMKAGITIKPIHKGIINYTSGASEDAAQKISRFLGIEYDNPDKKAEIHFLVTDEEYALTRAKTALLFFDPKKIHWND